MWKGDEKAICTLPFPLRQRSIGVIMIQMRTILEVADNSGAKKVGCIKVLGGTRRKYASLGDIIIVSVKDALPNSKIRKGDVVRAVIVRTKKEVQRPDGSYIKFDDNSAVLINPQGNRLGPGSSVLWQGNFGPNDL